MINELEQMKGKLYLYRNQEVVVLNYVDGTGEDGDEVEIYLNNGTTLVLNYANLNVRLNEFKPLQGHVVVVAQRMVDSVSTVNPDVMLTLRDTVMQQIKTLKEDPSTVNQAKQVFQGVNTMINLARVEMEYRKLINEMKQ